MTPLEKTIQLVGGQTALAKSVKVKQGHIWHWLNKSDGQVPPKMVLSVSRATGWQVTPHELRPDIYPNPDDGLPVSLRPANDEVEQKGAA